MPKVSPEWARLHMSERDPAPPLETQALEHISQHLKASLPPSRARTVDDARIFKAVAEVRRFLREAAIRGAAALEEQPSATWQRLEDLASQIVATYRGMAEKPTTLPIGAQRLCQAAMEFEPEPLMASGATAGEVRRMLSAYPRTPGPRGDDDLAHAIRYLAFEFAGGLGKSVLSERDTTFSGLVAMAFEPETDGPITEARIRDALNKPSAGVRAILKARRRIT